MSANRRIRMFVSSTFRDMVRERDELLAQTLPELRHFCRERQVELIEVELRWGIAEDQSTRKETLKLCLDEIRACRPFFVGPLGERYGWVPGTEGKETKRVVSLHSSSHRAPETARSGRQMNENRMKTSTRVNCLWIRGKSLLGK